MPGRAVTRGARNEVERISRARVLRLLVAVVIGDAGYRIKHHVFQNRAEAIGGGPDLRLGLGGQLDAFGVAAAFEIENAVLAPAVLVVTDERAVRIGRQRRFAGAGKTKEQRTVAVLAD